LGFGVCVLLFAPWLFDGILQGKYNDGLAVVPWAMAGCIWYGVFALAQNYLWCAEKSRLATLPLAIGLVINIFLNLLLLPMWGLYGALVATAVSSLICLTTILLISHRYGLPLDRGLWLTTFAPLSLPAGPTISAGVLTVLLLALAAKRFVLSPEEHAILRQLVCDFINKIKPYLQRGASVPGNA
jgi:O-antigen/teichoic acid export membrane protein